MSAVGERIRERRRELGWTQDRLAGEAGISKGFLSDVETGKRNLGADALLAVANALGVSMDALMKGAGAVAAAGEVQVPGSLSAFAKSANLSFAQALMLLDMQRQIVAHRSRSQPHDLEAVDWKRFYESVREFIA